MLEDINFTSNISWTQVRTNTGTNDTTQAGTDNIGITGVDTSRWNEIYREVIVLTSTNPTEVIDLTNLSNYVDIDNFAFGKVLSLTVKNLGDVDENLQPIGGDYGNGVVLVSPDSSDPADIFGLSMTVLVPGRTFTLLDDPDIDIAADTYVTDAHKNLLLELYSGTDCRVLVIITGSTDITA